MPLDDSWTYDQRDDGEPIYRKADPSNTVSVCVYQYKDGWQMDWQEANGDIDGYSVTTFESAILNADVTLNEMIAELNNIADEE